MRVSAIIDHLLNRGWVLSLVGLANRRLRLLSTIFLCYPGAAEYSAHYVKPHEARRAHWTPMLVGVYRQGWSWGLTVGIRNTEDELRDPDNRGRVVALVSQLDVLRERLGARHVLCAGILPGILVRGRVRRRAIEAETTVDLVVAGLDLIQQTAGLPPHVPVILLGGSGFLGRRLQVGLRPRPVAVLDRAPSDARARLDALRGKPVIILNLVGNSAFEEYAARLWPEAVVVNEAYPAPSRSTTLSLRGRGIRIFHICGALGSAYPSFPGVYRGAIPCCAAIPDRDHEVVVRQM